MTLAYLQNARSLSMLSIAKATAQLGADVPPQTIVATPVRLCGINTETDGCRPRRCSLYSLFWRVKVRETGRACPPNHISEDGDAHPN